MPTKTVYLSGPINGKTDEQCKGWRSVARSYLESAGHRVIDPMERDFRGIEDICPEEIVNGDKDDIELCDVLLVNANAPGWGTAMECMHATSFGKQVVAFATYTSAPAISPWLRCHSHAVYECIHTACYGIMTDSREGLR